MTVHHGDVFIFTGNGGGGVGDPLLRSPELVAFDARNGYVDDEMARTVYGVVVQLDGTVDVDATDQLRAHIRAERIGAAPTRPASLDGLYGGITRRDQEWHCGYCTESLGPSTSNFRDATVRSVIALADHHDQHRMHIRRRPPGEPQLEMRTHYCPACASAIVTDVALAGSEPVMAARAT